MNWIAREARPDEMDEIFRLRYKIFCEELKFADPADYPERLESDSYDSRSYHLVILNDNRIASYARLILPRENEKFLIEESVSLPQIFGRAQAVEVSRGLVVREERRSGVLDFLIESIFDYCRANGFQFLLSFSNKVMVDHWGKINVRILYKGECVNHHGFDTWPLIIAIE